MDLKFRTLNADEIDCRLSQVSKTNGSGAFLLYKDARVDMLMLDEFVGPMNWKREHTRDNANCIVSIWDDEKKQWISKEDTGTESNTEKEKGLASDSFKRACFNWGIGRELYTAPTIWVTPLQGEDIKYVRLRCTKIGYNDKREINLLELVDNKGNVRYSFGTKQQPKQQPAPTAQPQQTTQKKVKNVAKVLEMINQATTLDKLTEIQEGVKSCGMYEKEMQADGELFQAIQSRTMEIAIENKMNNQQ